LETKTETLKPSDTEKRKEIEEEYDGNLSKYQHAKKERRKIKEYQSKTP